MFNLHSFCRVISLLPLQLTIKKKLTLSDDPPEKIDYDRREYLT